MCDAFPTKELQDRLQSLHELTELTESCRTQLTEIFKELGWEPDWELTSQVRLFSPNRYVLRLHIIKHAILNLNIL